MIGQKRSMEHGDQDVVQFQTLLNGLSEASLTKRKSMAVELMQKNLQEFDNAASSILTSASRKRSNARKKYETTLKAYYDGLESLQDKARSIQLSALQSLATDVKEIDSLVASIAAAAKESEQAIQAACQSVSKEFSSKSKTIIADAVAALQEELATIANAKKKEVGRYLAILAQAQVG